MPVKVESVMSKKSAQAAAAKSKPAPKSKPASKKAAKPKKKTTATVAVKSKKAIQAEAKSQALELQLNKDADAAMKTLTDGIPDLMKRGESLQAIMEDVKKRELWRKGSNPFKSQSAFLEHFATIANVSIRTLQGTMGAIKALPGVSAAKRQAIGPRKLARLGAAARVAASKGEVLPPEVIEGAESRTEAEVEEDLIARGLKQRPEPEPDNGTFSYDDMVESRPLHSVLAEGDYGTQSAAPDTGPFEDVPHATPEPEEVSDDYSIQLPREGTSLEAVNAVQAIYPELNLGDANAVEWILADWLKTQCRDDVRFPDQTNGQAADSLQPKKNGKRKK